MLAYNVGLFEYAVSVGCCKSRLTNICQSFDWELPLGTVFSKHRHLVHWVLTNIQTFLNCFFLFEYFILRPPQLKDWNHSYSCNVYKNYITIFSSSENALNQTLQLIFNYIFNRMLLNRNQKYWLQLLIIIVLVSPTVCALLHIVNLPCLFFSLNDRLLERKIIKIRAIVFKLDIPPFIY